MKRKLIPLLVLLAFGFLLLKIYQQREVFSLIPWKFNPLSLLIMVILLVLNYLSNIFAWHILMKSFGEKISFFKDFRIWSLSSITRFLPGKIWQYPSRMYMLSQEGVTPVVSGTAMLAEILFNLSFGAVVVLISLMFWQLPEELHIGFFEKMLWLFLVLPFFLIVFTNKAFIQKLIVIIKRLSGKNVTTLKQIHFSFHWVLWIAFSFVIRYLIPGGVLFYLVQAVTPISISQLPFFIGAFSLSWLLGYIAVFAPAGLGVAELSLATVLALIIPFGFASAVAIAFRVVNLLAEMIIVGGLFIVFGKGTKKRSPA